MLNIAANIKVIEDLVRQNTSASLTYAALECRLTIEQLCYERLRTVHDYISHDDISKWQPRDVVRTLIKEVDPSISSDIKLSIAKNSTEEIKDSPSDETEFLEIGIQVGFNANRIGKLWNALANLALHIPVPKSKEDQVSRYGNSEKINKKITDCLVEFRRLSETTMMYTGWDKEVSFECFGCDNRVKRKIKTLDHHQVINCINPSCDESYEVEKADEEVFFTRRKVKFNCPCSNELALAHNHVGRMKLHEIVRVVCPECQEVNLISWRLHQAIEGQLVT